MVDGNDPARTTDKNNRYAVSCLNQVLAEFSKRANSKYLTDAAIYWSRLSEQDAQYGWLSENFDLLAGVSNQAVTEQKPAKAVSSADPKNATPVDVVTPSAAEQTTNLPEAESPKTAPRK